MNSRKANQKLNPPLQTAQQIVSGRTRLLPASVADGVFGPTCYREVSLRSDKRWVIISSNNQEPSCQGSRSDAPLCLFLTQSVTQKKCRVVLSFYFDRWWHLGDFNGEKLCLVEEQQGSYQLMRCACAAVAL